MRSRTRTVAANTLWSVLDLILDFTVPVLTSVLVARAMGPLKLGAYGYILWVSQLALIVSNLGVPRAAARFLAEHIAKGEEDVARAVLRLALVLQTASAAAMVGLGLVWALLILPSHERVYAGLAIVSVFPAALMGIASAINTAREDFGANVIGSVTGMVTQAVGVLLTLAFGWDLTGLATSLLVARTVECLLRWVLARARIEPGSRLFQLRGAHLEAAKRREVLEFCWHATLLLLINLVVWNRSEMLFLRQFCDLRQVAFFSIAFTFATIPTHIAGPFSRAAVATLYVEQSRSVRGAQEFAALVIRYMSLIVVPAAMGLAVVSGPLVRVFYGSAYAAAAPVLLAAALLGILGPLAEPATGLVTAAGGQSLLVRWGLVTAVVTLLLDVWLVGTHCAVGGAVANGCGQIISTLGVWMIARRRFGLSLPIRFLGSVSLAASLMLAAGASVAHFTADPVSLVLVPTVGVLTYLTLLRQLRVLDADDARRLTNAVLLLPSGISVLCVRAISWIVAANQQPGREGRGE